jgi:RNA polymerase sigma factor (TIGR02999 family)
MLNDAPITELLFKVKQGNSEAENLLMRLTNKVLCRMARRYLAAESRRHHTLQPGDLVNEYVVIARKSKVSYQSRGHFFAFAAKVMRHILVSYERRRNAQKRDGLLERVPLEDVSLSAEDNAMGITLRQLLERLKAKDPQEYRILMLRDFEGLDLRETAAAMRLSRSTVKRDYSSARAWLHLGLSKRTRKAGQS